MMPEFYLETVGEDMLIPILKKMDFKTGINVYRGQKFIKETVDQTKIAFYYPKSCFVLGYESSDVKKYVGLQSPGNLLFRWDSTWRKFKAEPLVKFSSVRLLPGTVNPPFSTIKEDLRAVKGFQQLIIEIDFSDDELTELIQLIKPKVLSYDFHKYLEKAQFFKAHPRCMKDVEIEFVCSQVNGDKAELRQLFIECNYLKTVQVHLTQVNCEGSVFMGVLTNFIYGMDMGKMETIRVSSPYFTCLDYYTLRIWTLNVRLIVKEGQQLKTGSSSFKYVLTIMRHISGFGKDIMQAKWSEKEAGLVIRFK